MPATKPDYGVDAPGVLRGLMLAAAACLLAGASIQHNYGGVVHFHVGTTPVALALTPMLLWTGTVLLVEAALYLLYVKWGKFRHRDRVLGYYKWRGDEHVLDVGCGRGLLLVGAAKLLQPSGRATGIDIWSNKDMGGNSMAATQRNIIMEGVTQRCELLSMGAQEMTFPDASFDVVVSNLCLHNIYDARLRKQAVLQIARVLKPGGVALLSDYKRTGEYARTLRAQGFHVERPWGSVLNFPPLRTVIARKP